jgi:hypothetical protein
MKKAGTGEQFYLINRELVAIEADFEQLLDDNNWVCRNDGKTINKYSKCIYTNIARCKYLNTRPTEIIKRRIGHNKS